MELAVCARQETNLVEQLIQFFEGASSENALGVSKVSTRGPGVRTRDPVVCTSLGKIVRRSDLARTASSGRSAR